MAQRQWLIDAAVSAELMEIAAMRAMMRTDPVMISWCEHFLTCPGCQKLFYAKVVDFWPTLLQTFTSPPENVIYLPDRRGA